MDKITVLYSRVSSDEQVEKGFSLESQKFQLLKYAEEHDIKDYMYMEDRGESATSMNRTAFSKIINMIKNKEVDKLIFFKIDRLSRNVLDFTELRRLCEINNTELISISENIDTTAIGSFSNNIMISLAEMESARIGERVKDVYVGMLENGIFPFGGPMSMGITKTKDRKLIYNDDIEIVKEIFENDRTGMGYQQNQRLINEKYNLKKSKNWVQAICKNTLYKGYKEYRGKKYYFLSPIIEEDYNVEKNKYKHKRNRIEHTYYLRDVLPNYRKSVKVKRLVSTGQDKYYCYYKNPDTGLIYNEEILLKQINKYIIIDNRKKNKVLKDRLYKLDNVYVMTKMSMEDYIEHRNRLQEKLGIVSKIDYINKIEIDENDHVTCFLENHTIDFKYNRN